MNKETEPKNDAPSAETRTGGQPVRREEEPAASYIAELTVEGILRQTRKLEERIRTAEETAKRIREQQITKGIEDIEALLADGAKSQDLLITAEQSYEYYDTMDNLGKLDQREKNEMQGLKTTIASLKKRVPELQKRILAISEDKELMKRMEETARKEHAGRMMPEIIERAKKELLPEMDELAIAINNFTKEKQDAAKWIETKQGEIMTVWRSIEDVVKRVKDSVKIKPDFEYELNSAFRNAASPDELRRELEKIRDEAGIFGGKKRAAIEYILSQKHLFEQYKKEEEALKNLKAHQDKVNAVGDELAERYKNIHAKVEAYEGQTSEFIKIGVGYYGIIPSDHEIERAIQYLARIDVKFDDKERSAKLRNHRRPAKSFRSPNTYDSWHEATSDDKEIKALYEAWHAVRQKGEILFAEEQKRKTTA